MVTLLVTNSLVAEADLLPTKLKVVAKYALSATNFFVAKSESSPTTTGW